MMKFSQLECLLALKQYGSISKAASHLYVSQPSLSRTIKELEEELGFLLVFRNYAGVVFTPLGEQVLTEAQKVVDSITRIRTLADEASVKITGELCLACRSLPCSSLLMDALALLYLQAPHIKIHSSRDTMEKIILNLSDKNLDMAVIHVSSVEQEQIKGAIESNNLLFEPLYSEKDCFLMRKNHPLLKQSSVSLPMLTDYPMVLFRENSSAPLVKMFSDYGLSIHPIYIDDTEHVQFIRQSDAIAPTSISTAKQVSTANGGSISWCFIDACNWVSSIGLLRRNEPMTKIQAMLARNLAVCAEKKRDQCSND